MDEFQARGVMDCAAQCLTEDSCVSLNWNDSSGRCELNSARKADHLSDILTSSSWVHYERNNDFTGEVRQRLICNVE